MSSPPDTSESPPNAVPLKRGSSGLAAGTEIIAAHLKTLPESPGVYRMLNADGTVLYVGKAKSLRKRVAAYTQAARLPHRLQRMVAQTRAMEFVVTNTESEALLLEASLIKRFAPPFNILLRDDKSFPYILLTRDHPFPALAKHRGPRERKGWYFGPFASGQAVTETLIMLQRGFMLRNCSDNVFKSRTRPCLQYHIKRCTAPCVERVTEKAYAHQVEEARGFLSGKSSEIQQELAKHMQKASDALDFERAALFRDRIRALTLIQSRQDVHVPGLGDADIIALHQQAGQSAIQMFFFRADRNYGTRSYFPSHEKDQSAEEILAAFLGQFYASHPAPPLILLSHAPEDSTLLEQAIGEKTGSKVKLAVPQLGDKKRLVDLALTNASGALARRMADGAAQSKLLQGVADAFDLAEPPKRIEVYDNSHIQGSHAVGAMIVAGPEGFLKKFYRKFTIRGSGKEKARSEAATMHGDDYAMMGEVFTRRFKRLAEEDPERKSGLWPDLVLIDGGQGQLNRALQVMADLGIPDVPLVGVAKGPDRDAGRERFFMLNRDPFSLAPQDPVLYYLQRLRDEAHRFAIGAHRKKRHMAIGRSDLDEVPGIGPARKRALLHHFGSARAVAEAGLDDLRQTPGISESMARKIYGHFHGDATSVAHE